MRGVASLVLCVASAWLTGALQPHPKVLEVRWQEEQLPPHQRSQALRNPHLRRALDWTSSLHEGEQQVYQHQADNIPRSEIFAVLAHAGLVPRQGRRVQSQHHQHQHHQHQPHTLFEQAPQPPFYPDDYLQYL